MDSPFRPPVSPAPAAAPQPAAEPSWPQLEPAKNGKHWALLVAVIVIILAIAGGGAYWLLGHRKPAASSNSNTGQSTGTTAQQPSPDTTTTTGLSQYVSKGSDLNLSFTYPSGWSVSPASGGNSSDQPITVTSPLISLPAASGQTVTGKVVVSIRPASAQLSELASDKAIVAQDSVQFAYTKPTADQHQYPYLTFVHVAGGSDTGAVFEEVIITGVTKFTKGQGLLPESLGGLDPIISAMFYQCATQDCSGSNATPLSITPGSWQQADAAQQVQALFASLQLN
ncbi:MAG TPA: hypothetical protein VHC98_04100 [Candidatus Saccharimonadales bacterium]|nr:hypothetical protein [Candidatus Saccharimonadales bacterium]